MACLWDVCGHFSRDTAVQAALNKLLSALGEAAKYQADLVDKASRAVKRNLQTFVKTLVCIYSVLLCLFSIIMFIYIIIKKILKSY